MRRFIALLSGAEGGLFGVIGLVSLERFVTRRGPMPPDISGYIALVSAAALLIAISALWLVRRHKPTVATILTLALMPLMLLDAFAAFGPTATDAVFMHYHKTSGED